MVEIVCPSFKNIIINTIIELLLLSDYLNWYFH